MVKSASPHASITSHNDAGGSEHRAAIKVTAAVAEAVRTKLVSDIQNGSVRRIRSRNVPPPKAVTSASTITPKRSTRLFFAARTPVSASRRRPDVQRNSARVRIFLRSPYFICIPLAGCWSRSTPSVHDGGSLAGKLPIKLRSISSSLISLTFVATAGSSWSLSSVIFFVETQSLFCFWNDLHRYLTQLPIKSAFATHRPPVIKIYFHRTPHRDPAGNR
jgi:hypothetical protein